jgi:hypothetical protein
LPITRDVACPWKKSPLDLSAMRTCWRVRFEREPTLGRSAGCISFFSRSTVLCFARSVDMTLDFGNWQA